MLLPFYVTCPQKTEYERDVNSLKQEIVEIRHQKNQLQRQSCVKYQKSFEKKSEAIIDLEKKLAISSFQTTSLQELPCKAEDKILILRDEKLFLVQEKCHLEGQLKQLETRM